MSFVKIASVVIIFILIFLPYYIFEGKLIIGGDQTGLQYLYPLEWIKHIAYFSWFNFSSFSSYHPSQYPIPFLLVWSLLNFIINSQVVIDYLTFSLPMILGFLFFQLSFTELFKRKYSWEIFVGALVYILSPITVINVFQQFLYTIWLIPLIPITAYFFLKYLKTANPLYIVLNILFSTLFAAALIAVPWLAGVLLPAGIGFLISVTIYSKRSISLFIKRVFIFFVLTLFSQAFWLLPFIANIVSGTSSDYSTAIVSGEMTNTFASTVLSTARGNNVFYPLLNLFHRQIAFDFDWPVKNVYLLFFDKTVYLNLIYFLVIIFGLYNYKQMKKKIGEKVIVPMLVCFVASLFFFTVNIGPLMEIFLFLGTIPGFVMFRNFYDKFALGYILFYSIALMISLIIINEKYKKTRALLIILLLCLTAINMLPIKQIINQPLWRQESVKKNILIPQEYLKFMSEVKNKIPSTNNILSLPVSNFYTTVIKDEKDKSVYTGTSPVKVFSGLNDFAGNISFESTASDFTTFIKQRNYDAIMKFLYTHNINYVFVTNNIPDEVEKSYLYNKKLLKAQDESFLKGIISEKIISSSNGNYELYSAKLQNVILSSKNLSFQKINATKYKIYIKHIRKRQTLIFLEPYHPGWKLYLVENPTNEWCKNLIFFANKETTECKHTHAFLEGEELAYSWKKSDFSDTHSHLKENVYINQWEIEPSNVKTGNGKAFYKTNPDGSIDIEMVLYFTPQNYFYAGSLISTVILVSLLFYTLLRREKHKRL